MTKTATHPPGASLHLGGQAWAHPELAPRLVDITTVTPYPGNPRRGDQDAITSSIRDLGLYAGVAVQRTTGHILIGNHRRHALTDLEATRLPVDYLDVDDVRAAAIVARDNRTSDLGGYDDAGLVALLAADGVLDLSGYDAETLDALVRADAMSRRVDPDTQPTPPAPQTPLTQRGDVWTLGRHKVMCGSSLETKDLEALLDGALPTLIHTDPPYGINIVKQQKVRGSEPATMMGKVGSSRIVHTTWYEPVAGDDSTDAARDHIDLVRNLWPNTTAVFWGANHCSADARLPNGSCWLVWDKVTGESNFADAELAWTNMKGAVRTFTHRWSGLLRDSERGVRHHPTQKPVALAQWVHNRAGAESSDDVILDGFGGAGFVLLAAEQSQSRAMVMELSPAYVDVMCRRWQSLTGIQPTRDGQAADFTREATP